MIKTSHIISRLPVKDILLVAFFAVFSFHVNAQKANLKGGISLRNGIEKYRIEVKFKENADLEIITNPSLRTVTSEKPAILKKFDSLGISLRPSFATQKSSKSNFKTFNNQYSFNGSNQFAGLMNVDCGNATKLEMLSIARYLETLPEVEYADLLPATLPPPPVLDMDLKNEIQFENTPDLTTNQNYFLQNPGINASYAWSQGIFGQDVHVADVEYDWDELHEDIPDSFSDSFLPVYTDYKDHGTAVLGIMSAADNGYGVVGGASQAIYRGYGEYPSGRSTAILKSLEWLKAGDVLILEMQMEATNGEYGPADLSKSVWDAVNVATSNGIHVIAAAGNGNVNLDNEGEYMARGDNRSILVGAGDNSQDHEKMGFSSYGSRVNLQGWGNYSVFTTGYGGYATYDGDEHRRYTATFSGTSSATAMVATSVILIQSWAKKELGILLTPEDMRKLLVDTGNSQGGSNTDKHIGPLPDIEAAINKLKEFPLIAVNEPLTLDEGATANITTSHLLVTDDNSPSENLIFTIESNPVDGYVQFNNNPGVAIFTFSEQDLIDEKVSYVHDDSNTNFDDFTFSISDGENVLNGQHFSVNINSIDDDPPAIIKNSLLELDEGATALISSDVLNALDTEAPLEQIKYTISTPLSSGQIENLENPGVAINFWMQNELLDGKIAYHHNGENTITDIMKLIVSDGSNQAPEISFNIKINPIDDDPPVLLTNQGLKLDEGATDVIINEFLDVDDTESSRDELLIEIISPVLYGQLTHSDQPGESITQFYYEDLKDGAISYIHDGSNTVTDQFTFQVSDGNNVTETFEFHIIINPIDDDAPLIVSNQPLILDEGDSEIITIESLNATDTEAPDDEITFTIQIQPFNGHIENKNASGVEITSFTRQSLLLEEIIYVHDDSETHEDSFEFLVTDGINSTPQEIFIIQINPVDDHPPVVETNIAGVTFEGGDLIITTDLLNVTDEEKNPEDIIYTVEFAGEHGYLARINAREESIFSFSQAEVINEIIIYVNDNSNFGHDQFELSVSDGSFNVEGIIFEINITLIDDDAPFMDILEELAVERNVPVVINNAILNAVDEEVANHEIYYSVIVPPGTGKLELISDSGTEINKFSQVDVDNGSVVFVPEKSDQTEDELLFTLTDGLNISQEYRLHISRVDVITGIKIPEINLNMYPNPASNRLFIKSPEIMNRVTIFDTNGKEVKSFHVNKYSLSLDLSDLRNSIYMVMVHTENKQAINRLVISR